MVGKDCCSVSSSDFRCPGYDTPHARAGVRVVRGYWGDAGASDEQFFQLAVQQWETRYGASSTYPIFLEWVKDPVSRLEEGKSQGMAWYFVLLLGSFVCQLLLVCLFTTRFSLIGRRPKQGGAEGEV